ncbi:sulfurtransferase [Promicromonospora sukumoe]|uniref:Thiosulfate/3-mercaptopyruvate sulfurtransferase n=1 Tax=Promicromonospora sukumoe TaxID=88382 RepID=A0A7W3JER8_9MICO|nr:sulfurtransferase [Promicromonospora sukumoe]MBA8811494.1 thiosulfate/3-mercaptopyruvate sulfurtransferase [Promicromonospora sukumoe]
MRERVLVDATTLAADLQVGAGPDPVEGRPVVLDVRWALGMTDGHDQYRAGHLPGAVYVDLETELAAHASPAEGRHPLPSASAFQEAARRWGVSAGSRVVVYDSVGGTSAARAWWLLRYFGVDEVRILDGGLAAWTAEGLAVEPGDVTPEPGDVVVRPGGMPVVDADGAAELADGAGVLLDARAAERYRGEVEPVDPQAGHVPGAVSAPTVENLGPDGRFLPTGDLRRRFGALGVSTGSTSGGSGVVGVYCGSGVTAAHQVAALAIAGVDAVLYPGSWSQWSNDPARPVAVGRSVRASG